MSFLSGLRQGLREARELTPPAVPARRPVVVSVPVEPVVVRPAPAPEERTGPRVETSKVELGRLQELISKLAREKKDLAVELAALKERQGKTVKSLNQKISQLEGINRDQTNCILDHEQHAAEQKRFIDSLMRDQGRQSVRDDTF